ncbi:hypothetical protein L3X38_036729 [Prunus dulcis]|uniref:DUF4283 domain-containing protein n=1 Tax=Prunus dulcis TaxID=3755 RepID=A0AAD4V3S5_PRUDU|nr:hypothetical protein L3X38_036729 [Prunus dulcis]
MLDVGGMESDVLPPTLPPISMSFKDKVSGDFGMAEDKFEISDDEVVIKHGDIPSFEFSETVKDCLYRPWRTAVIIKLMGRPLSYTFLRDCLLQRWGLKGPMCLIDLENNYFIVKFLLEEDKRYVLTGGPWQIAGQCIVAQSWKPRFNAKEERVTHMTAWIRINGLNVEYFLTDVMMKIGNLIGTIVKVDAHTMGQARGKFARLCVELDLSKPLIPFIVVEGRTFGVVYEGIQLVCFECGCFGHGRDACPVIVEAKKKQASEEEVYENMEGTPPAPNENVVADPANLVAEIPAKKHGQWMLMKPKNFRKKIPHEQGQTFSSTKKDDEDAGATPGPFGFKKASKPVAQAHERASPISKGSVKQVGTVRPRIVAKPDSGARNVEQNRVGRAFTSSKGLNAVGMQVCGENVQDDLLGKFSFNVEGPLFFESSFGKGGLIHDHEPPNIGQKVFNEAFSSSVGLTFDDMDHHGDFVDQGDAEFGVGMARSLNKLPVLVNVRGDGKESCARTIKDLKKAYAIDILAILEPRIGGARALQIAKNLGFSNYHIVDATGFSRGVWLLWNDNSISVQIIAHSSQSITALVQLGTNWWLLTVVYANPCPGIRESLWAYFDGLAQASKLPWLILGDFNDTVCTVEKSDNR